MSNNHSPKYDENGRPIKKGLFSIKNEGKRTHNYSKNQSGEGTHKNNLNNSQNKKPINQIIIFIFLAIIFGYFFLINSIFTTYNYSENTIIFYIVIPILIIYYFYSFLKKNYDLDMMETKSEDFFGINEVFKGNEEDILDEMSESKNENKVETENIEKEINQEYKEDKYDGEELGPDASEKEIDKKLDEMSERY